MYVFFVKIITQAILPFFQIYSPPQCFFPVFSHSMGFLARQLYNLGGMSLLKLVSPSTPNFQVSMCMIVFRKLPEDVLQEYKRKVTFLKDIVKADEIVSTLF